MGYGCNSNYSRLGQGNEQRNWEDLIESPQIMHACRRIKNYVLMDLQQPHRIHFTHNILVSLFIQIFCNPQKTLDNKPCDEDEYG